MFKIDQLRPAVEKPLVPPDGPLPAQLPHGLFPTVPLRDRSRAGPLAYCQSLGLRLRNIPGLDSSERPSEAYNQSLLAHSVLECPLRLRQAAPLSSIRGCNVSAAGAHMCAAWERCLGAIGA